MAFLPATEHEPAHTPPPPPTTPGWGLFRGALVVAVMLLLVGALAWIVFGYGTGNFVDSDAKRVLERQKILADRNAEDYKLLHDPASWLAKDKGIVRVPIDEAVEMTIPALQKVEPHPAYPVKQSPPQPAGAPTSPDKGAGSAEAGNAVNPPASNPTVAQPSPAPVVAAPTPAPATSASSPVPAPAVAPSPTPAPTPVPTPTATPTPTPTPTATPTPTPTPTATSTPVPTATPTPVPTATPTPAATAVPMNTPMGIPAPSPDNNANNPGSPPIPGTSVQPPAPTPAPVPTASPAAAPGAQPEPLMTPPSQPTPTGTAAPAASEKTTPTPATTEPGASPAGTP